MQTEKENALLWTVGNCLLIDGFATNRSIREHGQLRMQTILVPLTHPFSKLKQRGLNLVSRVGDDRPWERRRRGSAPLAKRNNELWEREFHPPESRLMLRSY